MSYLALYRKMRPKTFDNVIGQEHIVRTLKNQLETKRISHAYLFYGTRGTGKTSIAKILALAINCLYPVNGDPCLKCQQCLDILNQRSLNVIEIDAASNNGVDNIRDIREEVKYAPTEGKYKVYIIDEVHMLSTGAFNALLKTLEEPPEHVVFILATTEVQKIPSTILSRCQRFDFKRITSNDMSKSLKKYMIDENIEIDEDALLYISYLADGAFRDALSILDQCISFYFSEKITIEKVKNLVGSVDRDIFYNLTKALINFNSMECLEIINDIVKNGKDIAQFVVELIAFLRNLLIVKSANKNIESFDMSIENLDILKEIAEKIDLNTLMYYINFFSTFSNSLKYDQHSRVSFEIACIKLCNPQSEQNNEIMLNKIKKLEDLIINNDINLINKNKPIKNNEKSTKKEFIKAIPDDFKNIIKNFQEFLKTTTDPINAILTKNSYPAYIDGNILYIVLKDRSTAELIKNRIEDFKEDMYKFFLKEFDIIIITETEYNEKHEKKFGCIDDEKNDYSTLASSLNIDIIENN